MGRFDLEDEPPVMKLDGKEWHYHVRELDNRWRVVISQPGWSCDIENGYFYVSVERLDGGWQHVMGSSRPIGREFYEDVDKTFARALLHARMFYVIAPTVVASGNTDDWEYWPSRYPDLDIDWL
jgi:hypothetical protein